MSFKVAFRGRSGQSVRCFGYQRPTAIGLDGADMHSVVVHLRIPDADEQTTEQLRVDIESRVVSSLGFRQSVWVAPDRNNGEALSILLFDNEDHAQDACQLIHEATVDISDIQLIEVREIPDDLTT